MLAGEILQLVCSILILIVSKWIHAKNKNSHARVQDVGTVFRSFLRCFANDFV